MPLIAFFLPGLPLTVVVCVGNKVFAALQPKNVTVSGGRIDGVGVGGYLLGGGYSYLSDEVSLDHTSKLVSSY